MLNRFCGPGEHQFHGNALLNISFITVPCLVGLFARSRDHVVMQAHQTRLVLLSNPCLSMSLTQLPLLQVSKIPL